MLFLRQNKKRVNTYGTLICVVKIKNKISNNTYTTNRFSTSYDPLCYRPIKPMVTAVHSL